MAVVDTVGHAASSLAPTLQLNKETDDKVEDAIPAVMTVSASDLRFHNGKVIVTLETIDGRTIQFSFGPANLATFTTIAVALLNEHLAEMFQMLGL